MKEENYNLMKLKYKVSVTIEGYPAEIIDELVNTGLYGNSRAEGLRNLAFSRIEKIISDGILENIRELKRKKEES